MSSDFYKRWPQGVCYSLTNGGVALSKPLLVSTGCSTKQVTGPHSESASQGHSDRVSSPPFFNKIYFGHILSPPPTPLRSPHLHTHPASCSLPSLSKTTQKQNKNQNKQDKKIPKTKQMKQNPTKQTNTPVSPCCVGELLVTTIFTNSLPQNGSADICTVPQTMLGVLLVLCKLCKVL